MQRTTTKEKTILLSKELARGVEKLNLPYSALNEALNIAHEIISRKIIKRVSPKALAASILHLACKEEGHPILFKEICSSMGLNKKETKRALLMYSIIAKKFGKGSKPSIDKYAIRLVDLLALNEEVKDKVLEIVEEARNKGLVSGRNPISIVAAAIYYVCKKLKIPLTQREIASKAHITEVTIRNRYRELKRLLGEEEKTKREVRNKVLIKEA